MIEALKNVFSSKGKNEAAIVKTANLIRSRGGNGEVASLEDAVSAVISNITMETKRVAFQQDETSGGTPAEGDFLVPSVMLGMLLTQRMWLIFEEKFDGGRVATYVALRHCLENPRKDSVAVFTESAAKYNVLRKKFEEKGEEFNRKLTELIVSSFGNADNGSIASAFQPVFSLIREEEKAIPAA